MKIVVVDNVVDFTTTRLNYYIDSVQKTILPVARDLSRCLNTPVIDLTGLEARMKDDTDVSVVVVHDVVDIVKSTATSTVIWTPLTIFLNRKRMFMLRACYTSAGGAELMSCKKRTLNHRFKVESCPTVERARESALSYVQSFILPRL